MNAKAERIEHLIQIINRNLLLIYNGQVDGVIPLEQRSSGKIDTTVFNSDKFGYEMINFVRSFVKTQKLTISAIWERNFVKGLETLITECAVVKDDIERECFVSRVYVWFTDKLVERRDLPDLNQKNKADFNSLRASLRKSGGTHSLKALDHYEASMPPEPGQEMLEASNPNPADDFDGDVHFPSIPNAQTKRRTPHSTAVQQSYPTVLEPDMGNGYHPETQAEVVMHDLWLARRRQEAFQWKAKQNLALIMDRRSLHKSRLESDTLRRQETSSYLARGQQLKDEYGEPEALHVEDTKFAPKMRRPLSGRKHFSNIIVDAENDYDLQNTKNIAIPEPTHLSVVKNGSKSDARVSSVSRTVVEKKKKEVLPMRFKIDAPEGYAPSSSRRNSKTFSTEPQAFANEKEPPSTGGLNGKAPEKRSATAPVGTSRDSQILTRRVSVPKLFSDIAHMDNELQVHCQFSKFRRMPMTEEQQAWLENRADERAKKNKECVSGLMDKVSSTTAKKASGKTPAKGNKKVAKKVPPPATVKAPVRPKYASAAEFMDKHFPNFDGEEYPDAQGVLRCTQLEECNKVYMALSRAYPDMDFAVIEKALVTPQDRSEDVCLENMKDPVEGLMVNPLPPEYWRRMTVAKGKKGKKGGKKKKK